ncbi:hypothetical protein [Nocardiopsis valliformis]|uniref:hypothetical protein n=1 Tax=Nocardiopsis valliformis TaxID=239974 RepID=UPI00037C8A2E|nr:hypothetical protein [Nocardiopsis valliformis]
MPLPRTHYDWSFLPAGTDPIPWDPEEVKEVKEHYEGIVDRLEEALESLGKADDYGSGEAMDELSKKMEDLPKKLEDAKETYRAAVNAYGPYIDALELARDKSRTAAVLAKASALSAENEDLSEEARENAEERLDEHTATALNVLADLTTAADIAAEALNDATRDLDEQLLDAWDGVVDYLRDNPVIYFIAAVVVGIALLFVPGAGWAILAAALVGAIFLAIDLTMLHKEGKLGNNGETWATIGMGVVGMIPGVAGLRALGKTGRLGNLMNRAGSAKPGPIRTNLQNTANALRSTPVGNTVSNVLTRTSNFTQAARTGTLNGSPGQSLAVDMAINVSRDSATGAAGNSVIEVGKMLDGENPDFLSAVVLGAATGAPGAVVGTANDHNAFGAMFGTNSLAGSEGVSSPLGVNDQSPDLGSGSSEFVPSGDGSGGTATTTLGDTPGSPSSTSEFAPDGSLSSSTITVGDSSSTATVHQEFSSDGNPASTTIETPPAAVSGSDGGSSVLESSSGSGGTSSTPADTPSPSSSNDAPVSNNNTGGSGDNTPASSPNNSAPSNSGSPAETTITPTESGNPQVTSSGDFGTFTVSDTPGHSGNSDSSSIRYESPSDASGEPRTSADLSRQGEADVMVGPNEQLVVSGSGSGDRDFQVDGGSSGSGNRSSGDLALSRPPRQDHPDSTGSDGTAPNGQRDTSAPDRSEGPSYTRDGNEVTVPTDSGNVRVSNDDGTRITTPEGTTVTRSGAGETTVRPGDTPVTLTPQESGSPATVHPDGSATVTQQDHSTSLRPDGYDVSSGVGGHSINHTDGSVTATNSSGTVETRPSSEKGPEVSISNADGSLSLTRDAQGTTTVKDQERTFELNAAGVPVVPAIWPTNIPQRSPSGGFSNGRVTTRPDGSVTHPNFTVRPNGQGITLTNGSQSWHFDAQGRPAPDNPPADGIPGTVRQSDGSFTYVNRADGIEVGPSPATAQPGTPAGAAPQQVRSPQDGFSIELSPNGSGGHDTTVSVDLGGSDRLNMHHPESGGVNVSTDSGYAIGGNPGGETIARGPDGLFASTDGTTSQTSNGDLTTTRDGDTASTSPNQRSWEEFVHHNGTSTSAIGDNGTVVTTGPEGARIDTGGEGFTLTPNGGDGINVSSANDGTTVSGGSGDNSWQAKTTNDGTVSGRDSTGAEITAGSGGQVRFTDGQNIQGVRNPDGTTGVTVTAPASSATRGTGEEGAITVDTSDGTSVQVDSTGSTVTSPDGGVHEVNFPSDKSLSDELPNLGNSPRLSPEVRVNHDQPNQPVLSADRTVSVTNSRNQVVTASAEGTRMSDRGGSYQEANSTVLSNSSGVSNQTHGPRLVMDKDAPASTRRKTETAVVRDDSGTVKTSTVHNIKDSVAVFGPDMSRNPATGETTVEHHGFRAERTGNDDADLSVRPLGEDGPTVSRDGNGNTTTRAETVEVTVSKHAETEASQVTISSPDSSSNSTLTWSSAPNSREKSVTLNSSGEPVEISWKKSLLHSENWTVQISDNTSGYTVTRETHPQGPELPARVDVHLRNDSTGEVTTIDSRGNVRHDTGTEQVNISSQGTTTTTPKADSGTGTIRQAQDGSVEMRFKPTDGSDSPRVLSHIDNKGQVEARLTKPKDGDQPAESWGTGIDQNGQATVTNLRSWTDGPVRLQPHGGLANVDASPDIRNSGQEFREPDSLWGHDSRWKQVKAVIWQGVKGASFETLNQASGVFAKQFILNDDETMEESILSAGLNIGSGVSRGISDHKYRDTRWGSQDGLDRAAWQTWADITKSSRQQLDAARWGGMENPLSKDEDEDQEDTEDGEPECEQSTDEETQTEDTVAHSQ